MSQIKTVLLLTLVMLCAACAVAQRPAEDKSDCFTSWDNNYFYLSFRVDCPDVQGKHVSPNAEVTGDDGVIIYLETDNKHADKITPSCFAFAVSAGGGAQFLAGTEGGKFEPTPVPSFKYGTMVQGTVNNNDDIDSGYSIEMALPWDILKARAPKLGDMMSFNIVIRRNGWKPGEFAALAPRVKVEDDVLNPSKWANVVFTQFAFVGTSPGEKILSTRSIVAPPLINGTVDPREWPKTSSFALKLPVPAGFVYEAKFPIQRMAFAPYYYSWQRDPRKQAPYTKLVAWDGGIELQDYPVRSIGPWFSSDRVGWHKEQASDAIAAGIDVVLPVYRGDKASRTSYALKGLDCLVSALMELKNEGKPYPLIGMLFDCGSLETAYGKKPDLRSEECKKAFYGMVKDFFGRVPAEFRAFSQTAKPDPGRIAPLMFISGADSLSGIDDGTLQYVKQRFETDFGSPLMCVASEDFRSQLKIVDGYAAFGSQTDRTCDEATRIKICSIVAGYDDSAATKQGTVIRPREGGSVYEKQLAAVVADVPHWVVCGSWNDFSRATDLCASREYGRKYIDATLASLRRLVGKNDLDAHYLQCSIPRTIPAKQISQAEFVIRNIGSSPWRVSEGCALGYRWYKGGRYVSESKVRHPLDRDILPGETLTIPIGVATVDADGTALPDGNYEARFELIRLSDNKWFSALGDQPLIVPVTVGQSPEWRAASVSCDAPVMAASGHTYSVKLRVRNEGAKTWTKGNVKIAWKLAKVSNYTHDGDESVELVPTADVRSLLAADCRPGEVATFYVPLSLRQPNGKPLPAWRPDMPWSYQLRFDIHNGEKWLSELGSPEICRNIDLFDSDYGARIVDSSIPAKLIAGQMYPVKVVVRNNGIQTWDRNKTKVGYHWYHLDGNQMQWDGTTTPIGVDLRTGWPTVLSTKVKAPGYDGQYVLVWDMMVDDVWLSTLPITRGGDVLPVFVEVTNGKLLFADLGNLYDVCSTSPDTGRSAGDFDGKGSTFPAEYFPPDAGPNDLASRVFPSGYKWYQGNDPDGRVSFLFGDKTPESKNAVSCKGQKVIADRARYLALHIAAASSDGDVAGELSVNYGDGADTVKLAVSNWTTGPSHGESVVCATRHRHSHGGDEVGKPAYLYHYTIPLDPARTLTSITLPSNTNIKVAAITLERVSLPAVPAAAPSAQPAQPTSEAVAGAQ